jgi:hypothetical protein
LTAAGRLACDEARMLRHYEMLVAETSTVKNIL